MKRPKLSVAHMIPLAEACRRTGQSRKRLLPQLEALNETPHLRGLVLVYVGKRKRPHVNEAVLLHLQDLVQRGIERRLKDLEMWRKTMEVWRDEVDAARVA